MRAASGLTPRLDVRSRLNDMARRRFFVDEIHSGHARIQGEDAHHLTRVLRVEPGQKYEISNNGSVYLAEIETARKDLVSFSVIEKLGAPEAGVERLVPFMAERSEKGLERAAGKRLERWRKIAREASEQSRRSRLPSIVEPVPFPAATALEAGLRLALEEKECAAPILSALPRHREPGATVALLLGPEGGWTDRERAAFSGKGWSPVSLGATILRAETAAIAGIAVISSAWAARAV